MNTLGCGTGAGSSLLWFAAAGGRGYMCTLLLLAHWPASGYERVLSLYTESSEDHGTTGEREREMVEMQGTNANVYRGSRRPRTHCTKRDVIRLGGTHRIFSWGTPNVFMKAP